MKHIPRKRCCMAQAFLVTFFCSTMSHATTYTWDNTTGNNSFQTSLNWLPTGVPGTGDTAWFNTNLADDAVDVADGTAIDAMQVNNSAIVDLTIGDGTTASRFDLDQAAGDSLIIGSYPVDTAELNLKGGWLDTYRTRLGGRAIFNVVGSSVWDSTSVLINGETVSDTAGIGVGQSAQVYSSGYNVDVGSSTGSGRVAVDGTPEFFLGPAARWGGIGTLDIGPDVISGFNFGWVRLYHGGQMSAIDAGIHGTTDVSSYILVESGGNLEVVNELNIGPYSRLDLDDTYSRVSVGVFTKSGGMFDWTGGTLEITGEAVTIDNLNGHSVIGSNLNIGTSKVLNLTYVDGSGQTMLVGNQGSGVVTIENGGQLTQAGRATLGWQGSGNGTVTVQGTGSHWQVNDIRLSQLGPSSGTLNILDGGRVTTVADVLLAGFDATAYGEVFMMGEDSLFEVGGNLSIGGQAYVAGGTGEVYVGDGSRIEVAKTLKVWGDGTFLICGSGSVVADRIELAPGAVFGFLTPLPDVHTNRLIGFGDNVNFDGALFLGHSAGASDASHSVGAGQTFMMPDNWLYVGEDKPATFTIENGGYVKSLGGAIGKEPGTNGSTVTVRGSWRTIYGIEVGQYPQGGDSATLLIENQGFVYTSGIANIWPDSNITLDNATLKATVVDVEGGVLQGTGSVILEGVIGNELNNEGDVIPGLSIGKIDVSGIYNQLPAGALHIEIGGGGGVPGNDYDQLNITGPANLAGRLLLSSFGPYIPAEDTTFRVLATTSGVSGHFDHVSFPYLGIMGLGLDYSDPNGVWVHANLSGDLNGDGFVGLDDLDIVLTRWNMVAVAGVWGQGDPSGDGFVGLADLDIILTNWNNGTPPSGATATIPEPTAMGVFVSGLALFITQRRSR